MALHSVCSWDESPGRRYRYWLEATLENNGEQEGTGVCLFLMLNPNRADYDRSDETVDRCKHLACEWGYGILWVCNLFPVRGGNWNRLPQGRMGPRLHEVNGFNGCEFCRNDAHDGLHVNDRHIMEAASRANRIVCAWGGKGAFDQRGREVVRMLVAAGHQDRLYTFGLTQTERQPRHAKPQLRGLWPKPEDLTPWTDVEQWLTERRSR